MSGMFVRFARKDNNVYLHNLMINQVKKSMRKMILFATLLVTTLAAAQTDKIYKHNGEVVDGKVLKNEEYTVVFKYDGEDAENSISKYAVEKIVYGKSGRTEQISDRITVKTEADWEKVVILEEKAYITGLKKVDEVRGKTGLINYHTGNTGDKKAEKKLKMEAAQMGCPFILMTADKATVGASSNTLGGSQVIKKGVAYKY
jgi:sRNA-binding regulator protein Hfq